MEMVKTHQYSKFTLMDLDGIRKSADVILQIEKTESTFTNNATIYLVEVVPKSQYPISQAERRTLEQLSAEINRVNEENRKLRRKISRMEKALSS